MPKPYRPKEVVTILEAHGFVLTRQKGSHARFKHPNGQMVSVPMHASELPRGTLHSIIKQSGLNRDIF